MLKIRNATNFRRTATGLSLIGAALLTLAGLLATPWESEDTLPAYLDALAASPVQGQVAATLLHYGYLLYVPGFIGLLALFRSRGIVLGHVGVALAVLGWASVAGFLIVDFYDLALAEALPRAEGVAIEERVEEYPGILAFYLPGIVGAMIGPPLVAVALWRAGHVGWWLAVAAAGASAVSMLTFLPGLAWSGLFGILGVVTWGYLGVRIVRTPDRNWEEGRLESLGDRKSSSIAVA